MQRGSDYLFRLPAGRGSVCCHAGGGGGQIPELFRGDDPPDRRDDRICASLELQTEKRHRKSKRKQGF